MIASPRLIVLASLAVALLAAGPAGAAAVDNFYERAVMTEANARCGLFAPPLASALAASAAQARGAALRSGLNRATLDQVALRARDQAARTACNAPDLTTAANRVRSAFEGFARMQKMVFAGDAAAWTADRSSSAEIRRWRLSQSTRFGWDSMTFGLVSKNGPPEFFAVANFSDGAVPYAARIIARDVSRAPDPFLNAIRANAAGKIAMADRMPPRPATRAILAEARGTPNEALFPADPHTVVAFRFPLSAADALAGLDPREVVAVDFLFASASGESVRTAYVEVGDFAAGRAFLAVPRQ